MINADDQPRSPCVVIRVALSVSCGSLGTMSSDAPRLNPRAISWAATMQGHGCDLVVAHRDSSVRIHSGEPIGREAREEREAATLRAE